MVSFAGINWLAVLVGVVFSNALGFLWYGPLFSKPWLKALGKTEAEVQGSPSMYPARPTRNPGGLPGLTHKRTQAL